VGYRTRRLTKACWFIILHPLAEANGNKYEKAKFITVPFMGRNHQRRQMALAQQQQFCPPFIKIPSILINITP
jgi:hypothetical protein